LDYALEKPQLNTDWLELISDENSIKLSDYIISFGDFIFVNSAEQQRCSSSTYTSTGKIEACAYLVTEKYENYDAQINFGLPLENSALKTTRLNVNSNVLSQ
jgi:hypothetical protein